MTKQERQKLSILVVLLAVLGLTLLLGYRMNTSTTAAVEAEGPATNGVVSIPAPSDARIRMDIVEMPEAQDAGRKDLFRYRQAPPPPPPVPGPGATTMAAPPVVTAPPVQQPGPPVAPPPPSIPLQYQGFAVDKSPEGGYIAFLAEGSAQHYNVKVGEVLMGRFRITRISEASVEVEDLEYNRRQTLPLVK
jgi:hypothetical protein